jgi:LmbE family N-acetylglucosaminyl deacetylase
MPGGSERVLVIAPHPDDETLGCGGAIALHFDAGDAVCVLVVTDGGSSRAGGLSREEIRPLRRAEAGAAVSRLLNLDDPGRHLQLLDLPEGNWAGEQLEAPLRNLLESFRPSLVYTTSCIDFHPQHLKVAESVANALGALSGHTCRAIRIYELQVPLTPALANVMVDITSASARKYAALREYQTQIGSFRWVPRAARYLRGLYRQGGTIEVFWELEPRQFCRLMSDYKEMRPRFCSIRIRPFSDGLAWLVGLRSRLALKRLAVE